MKTLRPRVILFALLGLASCAPPGPERTAEPADAPVFDQLIVPGKRIGPIAVGMPAADVLKAVGEPFKSVNSYCKGPTGEYTELCSTTYEWTNGLKAKIPLITRGNWVKERVFEIITRDLRHATAEGVKVGSTELSVRAKYGSPTSTDTLLLAQSEALKAEVEFCYSSGIALYIGSGKVVQIDVGRYSCR